MENYVGIDLAGDPKNPTGWAFLHKRIVKIKELFSDEEILRETLSTEPDVVAIDAPLTLPKKGVTRKADRNMHGYGYHVLPPLFPAMKMLTYRGIGLAEKLREKRVEVIEVHPASTRKALAMSTKDWKEIQKIFTEMSLEIQEKVLTSHQIDAITSAITAHLHAKGEEERVGDEEEGYIIVPAKKSWRGIKL